MPRTSSPVLHLFAFAVLILIMPALFACAGAEDASEMPPERDLGSQGQALSDDSQTGESAGEPGPVFPSCPEGQTAVFKLQFNHTWEFKPSGQGELMTVKGHTTPDAWCLINVTGTKVEAEDCVIGYEYSGFLQTSDGQCDIQGASTALVEFEGECMPPTPGGDDVAEIYLTITEGQDPDADLSGALNCRDYSGPYMGFYPPSFSVMSFLIQQGGSIQTDDMDETGQFDFSKQWMLIPSGFPFPP